jgi:hypothetical protein
MDRRAIFFVGAGAVCAALIPPTDAELRWVPLWMAIVYGVLAVLSFLDWWSRRADHAETRSVPKHDAPSDQPNRPVM